MKRILLLVAVAATAALVFFLLRRNLNSTAEAGIKDFAIEQTNRVDKIFFSKNSTKDNVLLQKDEAGNWTVKNAQGVFPASKSNIDMLLNFVMNKLQVKYPVGDSASEEINRTLYLHAVKAEFYLNDKLSKTLYVGGPTQNSMGTYMYMPGLKRPYVVEVPGFEGYVTPYFSTNLKDWRSKEVLNATADNIRRLEITWHEEPSESFVIDRPDDAGISLLDAQGRKLQVPLNPVRSLVGMFEHVQMEGWPNLPKQRADTVLRSKPFCTLKLNTRDGKTQSLELFRIPVSDETYSQENRDGSIRLFEIEYFWARVNGANELVQMQDAVLRNRLKKLKDFTAVP
jgi:hypothetical protein